MDGWTGNIGHDIDVLVPGEDDQLDGRRDVIAGYLCTDSTCSSESRLWLLGVLLESYFVLVWL